MQILFNSQNLKDIKSSQSKFNMKLWQLSVCVREQVQTQWEHELIYFTEQFSSSRAQIINLGAQTTKF